MDKNTGMDWQEDGNNALWLNIQPFSEILKLVC